jgi:biotin-dependent carboxylase-like uncharacterized protein
VLDPGPLTLVEDLGRHGFMAVGVPRAGAADLASYLLGGRLLGNAVGAPALEVTLGGLRLRASGQLLVCLTGAPCPAHADGRPVPWAAPVVLRDRVELTLGMPSAGLRTYVSVRGGLAVPEVLGSASTDTLSGLGPQPLRAGQVLRVGDRTEAFPLVEQAVVEPPPTGPLVLGVLPGPRQDWFADPRDLAARAWVVSDRSDRRGVRLQGPALRRAARCLDAELPSEGMVRGALQVPPNGQPVLLLSDHPVTGGYPVIGVVRSRDVDRAAQLRPGQVARFRWER